MKYLRLVILTFYFSTVCVLLNYASAEPRSAGRLAAKLDYCGHYIESSAISDTYYGFHRWSLFIGGNFYSKKKSASGMPWVNFQREYHQNEIGDDGLDPETGLEVDCGNSQNAIREALHWALTRQDWVEIGGSYKLKWSVEKINRQGNLGVKYFPVKVPGSVNKNRNNDNAANNLHLLGKQTLCKVALKTNGILWDLSSDYFIENVNEAKSRGLSEQDCARILGRTTTVASSSTTSNTSDSKATVSDIYLGAQHLFNGVPIETSYRAQRLRKKSYIVSKPSKSSYLN